MATVAQIKADLTKKVGIAMEGVKKQVENIFFNVIMQYYGEYSPNQYIRTWQIAQLAQNIAAAAVKVRVVGASFEIYFDASMLNYPNGQWSEQQVLDNVMVIGNHGGASAGTPVWTTAMGILDPQMKSIVKEELIKAGIPIH